MRKTLKALHIYRLHSYINNSLGIFIHTYLMLITSVSPRSDKNNITKSTEQRLRNTTRFR